MEIFTAFAFYSPRNFPEAADRSAVLKLEEDQVLLSQFTDPGTPEC